MRRSVTDITRRRQELADRRFRGHRIKSGLGELGDLDAPAVKRQRADATVDDAGQHRHPPTAAPAAAAEKKKRKSTGASSGTAPANNDSGGGDFGIRHTVFGADWSSWMGVKRVLFDMTASVAEKKTVLRQLRVWHCRATNQRVLPPYIEASEVLFRAVLLDEEGGTDSSFCRLAYGAAISRAVHLMTGSFAAGTADTYRKRAREIGFPEEAVEVRQRMAHGAMPGLSELRWVAGGVLQFVYTNYWLEQERQLYLMRQHAEPVSRDTPRSSRQSGKKMGNGTGNLRETSVVETSNAASLTKAVPSLSVSEIKDFLMQLDTVEEEMATATSVDCKRDSSSSLAANTPKSIVATASADTATIVCGSWQLF